MSSQAWQESISALGQGMHKAGPFLGPSSLFLVNSQRFSGKDQTAVVSGQEMISRSDSERQNIAEGSCRERTGQEVGSASRCRELPLATAVLG